MWDGVSVVGLTTRYGLYGLGIKCRWALDFPRLSIPALGPTQPPVKWVLYLVSFPEVKRPGHGVDHPPASSTEVKERVEPYFWVFMACSRVNFTLFVTKCGNYPDKSITQFVT
jgi:hypothetical protein